MCGFLARLLGIKPAPKMAEGGVQVPQVFYPTKTARQRKVDEYYRLMGEFKAAKKGGHYDRAMDIVAESVPYLPALARESMRSGGDDLFLSRIPIIDEGAVLLGAAGRKEQLRELHARCSKIKGMRRWVGRLQDALDEAERFEAIMSAVHESPGISAKELKKRTGISDGRELGRLVQWLDKMDRVRKEGRGSSWALWPETPEGEHPATE